MRWSTSRLRVRLLVLVLGAGAGGSAWASGASASAGTSASASAGTSASAAPGTSASAAPGPSTETAAPADPRAAEIRRLLDATGATAAMLTAAESDLTAERAAHPEIPAAFWDGLRAELTPAAMESLLIPIYEAHFSSEEVALLLLALDNPAVRKLLAEQPALVAEATAAGDAWGRAAAKRVQATILPAPPHGP